MIWFPFVGSINFYRLKRGYMCKKRQPVLYLFFPTLLLLFSPHEIFAGDILKSPVSHALLKRIALFPFTNYTQDRNAGNLITAAVKKEMLEKGYFVVDGDEVEDFLAKRRIRYTNTVARLTAREAGSALSADAVMVGSVDIFEEKDEPVIGITARLVSSKDGSIIWAKHVSSSSHDHEGLLGLGVVKSADKLISMVTRDLVGSLSNVRIVETELRPFEFSGMAISPANAKYGDKVRLKVKVTPITGEPVSVKVVINNYEISLSGEGGGHYGGVVDAPEGEGIYPVDVIVYDQDMRQVSFKSCGKLSVNNTPPNVALTLNKNILASRRKGFVTFTPTLKGLERIDEWKIEILDSDGRLVRSDGGFGKLPKKLIWKGEANNSRLVDDGVYTVRFIAKDAAGNQATLSKILKVKNSPPEIKVNAELVKDKVVFTFAKADKDETLDQWKVSIIDNSGNILEAFNGRGELPDKLEYPLKYGADFDNLSFSIMAVDDAGNTFEFKKFIKTFALKNTPFAKVDRKERVIDDF